MSILLLLFTTILYAAHQPQIPEPSTDTVLTGGLSARDFFTQKSKNATCVEGLTVLKENYRTLRKELRTFKSAGAAADALDAKEKQSKKVLEKLVMSLQECGECTQQNIRFESGYTIADGSCQLASLDKSFVESVFQKSTEDLLNMQKYGAKADGFSALLEFVAMDFATGELLPNVGKIPSPTRLHAFVAVEGPIGIFGLMGFQYISDTTVETREVNGLKELIIKLNGAPFPDGFEAPPVYAVSASGKKTKSISINLTEVQGMWFLNSDGYSRYYTAAKFGKIGELPSFVAHAKKTLINTLYRQVERSLGEP